MTEKDIEIVCSTIDKEKEFFNCVSQDIWRMPELQFKEVHAHAVLTSALQKYGYPVEKHYFMPTAFRAEFCVKAGGPTIAILLEYDALPDIGHACGHNLIAEAGLAAAVAVKKAMEVDRNIAGKIVVLGTPAEELGGGKIRLIELGAFENIDAALMAHPAQRFVAHTTSSALISGSAVFKGQEAHAAASPWEGINALDAAVACYNGISALRQQIKPTHRIHAIITEGGTATNIIPARSKMEFTVRTDTIGTLDLLKSRVESCIKGAATSTGCTVEYRFDEDNAYFNMISNRVLSRLFEKYGKLVGVTFTGAEYHTPGSTDMGNVSHIVPSIHSYFRIPSDSGNHTRAFADAAGFPAAQEPTLLTAKSLALTCLALMRNDELLQEAQQKFQEDLLKDMSPV